MTIFLVTLNDKTSFYKPKEDRSPWEQGLNINTSSKEDISVPIKQQDIAEDIIIETDNGEAFFESFENGVPETWWYKSDFVNRTGFIKTGWEADNIIDHSWYIELELNHKDKQGKEYTWAELQRQWKNYRYGRYEVTMQPSWEQWVNSSFFVYTGKYYGDAWNEIDFEFLWKAPTKVHIAYHTEYEWKHTNYGTWVELWFDASLKPHTYAFEWERDSIRWFAEKRLIYEITKPDITRPIPKDKTRIFMNIWHGSPEWLWETKFEEKTSAKYYDVRFTPLGEYSSYMNDPVNNP